MGNQPTKEYPKYRSANKKNVHWEEAERPHPPGQPILVPASPGGSFDVVTIRWDPPISDGGTPITGYLVEHRRTGSPHWVRATPSLVTRCQLSLSGLEPGWRYQFRVCAENAAGRSDPSGVSEPLTVTLAKGVASAPHFTKELQDAVALENEKVELSVRVTGSPTPRISWFKDGLEVFSGRRSRVVTDGEGSFLSSSLIIHQAALSDEGEIKCAATNRAGHAVTKARLRLEAPPSIRLPRQYEDGLLFELGEVIRVKVSVAGRPAPRVTWLHNGEAIRPGPRHEITATDRGAALRVSEARRDDRGEYQVRAVNQLGEDVSAFLVTVTDRPTPPGKAMVAMTLGRSVTLTWGPPEDDGGCKIGNYIVEYYRVGWDMWLKAATCRQLTTTLGDLIEGSEYKFRVKAENPYGVSEPGDESETVFIPDPKRGITDPPHRNADGSETNEWWNNHTGEPPSSSPSRKRPAAMASAEDVSPIPSPVPRVGRSSRATAKTLSLPRTRSAAPDGRRDEAPEPPKRRNRSLSRGRQSVSPDPDSMDDGPVEMGVVKGRLFGIHVSSDSLRVKRSRENVGIEEVVYATTTNADDDDMGRQSPLGAAPGDSAFKKAESAVDKYEAKLKEIEKRQKELEERERERMRQMEEEHKKELEERKEKERQMMERQLQKEKEQQKQLERDREKDKEKDQRKEDYVEKYGAKKKKEQFALRSEDGSMAGDSSEFLLVLVPNSRATTEEREETRSESVRNLKEEQTVAPPMSLSAPELGAIDPDVPFLRNAVSSTELLHERAMARFYQEVAEEEAEKARKRRTSIERRVSLERRQSIERKNRGRVRGRIGSVDEAEEDDMPVNFNRFAGAKPSDGSRPVSEPEASQRTMGISNRRDRVLTSEEREEAEFAALRERLSKANQDARVADRSSRLTDEEDEEMEDDEEYLDEEELEEEEDEEVEDEEELSEEDMPEEPEPYVQLKSTAPPPLPKHRIPDRDLTPPPPERVTSVSPEPPKETFTFIPKASTYTTTTEHDNVASTLLTKRHSPVKGDVKPKPILKKRGSMRRNKTPPSPKSKSPLPSPLNKIKNKLKTPDTDKKNKESSEDNKGFNLFKPIKRKPEDTDGPAPPGQDTPPVKMRTKQPRPEEQQNGRDSLKITKGDTPEDDLGISAAEAARTKRGLVRKDSIKDEAAKVVISHYSELVREFGGHKPQQAKYLSYDELKAKAEHNSTTEIPVPPEAPEPASSSARESLPATVEPPTLSAESAATKREPPVTKAETTPAKRDTSVTRRESSRKRDSSVARRESSVAKRERTETRRDTSVSRRDRSASRRDSSVTRRDTSVSAAARKKDTLAPPRHRRESDRSTSVNRSPTSVASSTCDLARARTPDNEEAMKIVEENVKSTIAYITDFAMFILAVWLYLFKSEILAVPVLALLVFRQAKEELKRRMPAWALRLFRQKRPQE